MARIIADMEIGQKINKLTLKEKFRKNGTRWGKFECDCKKENPNIVEKLIWMVVNEKTKSCSCLKKIMDRQKIIERCTTHGMSDTVEHNTWMSMKARCYKQYDNNYIYYGGRGVRICDEWLSNFSKFYEDMGPKPQPNKLYHIGRKDHDKPYCKENCRWATKEDESVDSLNNLNIIAFGQSKRLLHWLEDERCKAGLEIIKYRLWSLGWSTEKAISTSC